MSSPDRSLVRDGVAAALLFTLLLEWLRPLIEMSEWSGIYRISPFMIAFALFVAVNWLRLSPWICWPVNVAICLSLVAYLFDSATILSPSWLIGYAELTMKDALAIADNDFAAISPDNRTMLFLLGWSMMIHVMYASVVERKRPIWFVAATLLYLLGLQLWPGVNTSAAIIRTVWFGFLLLGLLHFSRLESRFALKRSAVGWPLGPLAAVPLLLAAAVAAGLWLPPAMNSGVMKPIDAEQLVARLVSWNTGVESGKAASGSKAVGTAATATTGYGGDDTVLGGSVRVDESVAFTAITEQLTYWRGEAKTFYTGRGWESGGSVDEEQSPQPTRTIRQEVTLADASLAERLFAGGKVERIEQLIARSGRTMEPKEAVLNVYGSYLLTEHNEKDPLHYYRLQVAVPVGAGGRTASGGGGGNEGGDEGRSGSEGGDEGGNGSEAAVDVPETSRREVTELGVREPSEQALGTSEGEAGSEVTEADAAAGTSASTSEPAAGTGRAPSAVPVEGMPEESFVSERTALDTNGLQTAVVGPERSPTAVSSRERFKAELQLPPSLPDRVRLLAETLTMDDPDNYSRAAAIEAYLKTNYTYSMDVPELSRESADFADAFLFESKIGYCDYFSTSMVVLLRSAGIPARWVKGFSPGEVTGSAEADGKQWMQVTVRNLNAHSWVEAYIEGRGWTTFDPTPGSAQPIVSAPAFAQASPAPARNEANQVSSASGLTGAAADWALRTGERLSSAWEQRNWQELAAALRSPLTAALLALTLLLLLMKVVSNAARKRKRSNAVSNGGHWPGYASGKRAVASRSLDKLWAALYRRLGAKKPAWTVREYVDRLPLEEVGKREALLEFVRQYEAVRYGGAPLPRSAKRFVIELWRRIKARG